MNGGIIIRNNGPVGWLGERQECTSLSSCEAEICATNATSKKVVDFRNLCLSASESRHTLTDPDSSTLLYSDNDACVKWSYDMTSKAACHIELRKNSVWEWVQDTTLKVLHVAGKLNPADIFMKKMRDGTHFRHLRNSFMSHLSDFLHNSVLAIHHAHQSSPNIVVSAAARLTLSSMGSSFITVLALSLFLCTLRNIPHLFSAGCQLLWNLYGFVPSL